MRAKKSLGQNFLVDENAIQIIADLIPEDCELLLEIGPGRGALSSQLARKTSNFVLLEKDEELLQGTKVQLLSEGYETIKCIEADALEFDFLSLWNDSQADIKLSVASNLPYNVATEIFFRLFDIRDRIDTMALMFQKEVAERFVAKENSKSYNAISVVSQIFFEATRVLVLGPNSFKPQPKVQSSVIHFQRREVDLIQFSENEFLAFRALVRAAFASRRKTIENSFKLNCARFDWAPMLSDNRIAKALESANIDPKRRAQNLSIPEFEKLFRAFQGAAKHG